MQTKCMPKHRAWIFDEYSKFKGFSPAVVTGKPAWLHGSLVRDSAPGHGVVLATREFLRHTLKTHIDDHTYIVQGYGKVNCY